MNADEAQQVFDGCMLSDAQLIRSHNRGNAYFNLAQSGSEHVDWLEAVAEALMVLGLELCKGYPKMLKSVSRGKEYHYCRLDTKASEYLTTQYYRWYPGSSSKARSTKVVYRGLKLSSLSLANWYMGDGALVFHTGFYGGYLQDHYNLTLSPAGFAVEDIAFLEEGLSQLGLNKIYRSRDKRVIEGSGINLAAKSIAEINQFIDLVESYIVPSFRHLCRRPQYKVNFRKPR